MESGRTPVAPGTAPRLVAPQAFTRAFSNLVQNMNSSAARAQGIPLQPGGSEKQQVTAASAQAVASIAATKRVAGEIATILSLVAQRGEHETEPYRKMAADYKKLTQSIQEAERQYKTWQESQVAALTPAGGGGAPPGVDLSGITPLKATLGPAGQPGMVSRGPEVANLQNLLRALGFPVSASGAYDMQTRAAVLRFQSEHKLQPNGVIGSETRREFNGMLKV